MRAEEIRELTDEEMDTRIAELAEERFRLRIRGATQTLEDPLRLRALRKDVARLKTILRQRQLAATPPRAAR
jgi:large subunit ribosomal protein L29